MPLCKTVTPSERARIETEESLVFELQALTDCTRAEALIAARRAIVHCETLTRMRNGAGGDVVMGRHGPCLEIRCTTNPKFVEHWSDQPQGRERCDELNRNLAHPAYFIA